MTGQQGLSKLNKFRSILQTINRINHHKARTKNCS